MKNFWTFLPCRHSGPPSSPGPCGTSRPSKEDDEDDEEREEMEEAEEEQGGDEEGGHWELWLGTADCVLWEGTWAAVLHVFPDGMHPIPFSVKNSSRSMYCSWNRPPSHGNVRSQSNGPRKADWLVERTVPFPPFMPPAAPNESSSESRGLSLSESGKKNNNLFSFLFNHTFFCKYFIGNLQQQCECQKILASVTHTHTHTKTL